MSARKGHAPIAVYGALAANLGIAVMKFAVAGISRSSAMFSEAMHSSVDTVNELVLLFGVHRARRVATPEHPYGYGKEIFFWGFVVAIVVFAGGGGVALYDGIAQLRHPVAPRNFGWKAGSLLVAAVFEGASFALGLRSLNRRHGQSFLSAMHRSKDPAVYTVVVEDFAALAGLAVALVGIILAHGLRAPWIDGAASIAIGLILCAAAVVLGAESRGLIVGESASPALIASVRRIAENDSATRRVAEPLTMLLGPAEVLVNLAIELDPLLPGGEVPLAIARIEAKIRETEPSVRRIFLEASLLGRIGDGVAAHERGGETSLPTDLAGVE